jgi:hypothetical protein
MKHLQQLCAAAVLTLLLSTSILAGDISTGGKTEPPPASESSAMALGENQIDQDLHNQRTMSNSVFDAAVKLLRTMLIS